MDSRVTDYYKGNYLLTAPHVKACYIVTDVRTYSDGRMECVIIASLKLKIGSNSDYLITEPRRQLIIKGDYVLEEYDGPIDD